MSSLFRHARDRTAGSPANMNDQPPKYGSLNVSKEAVNDSDKEKHAEGVVGLFYRIYNKDGGIPSKVSVDSKNPYLACIDGHLVAPPHTAASIKRCICKLEMILDTDEDVRLFSSASKTTPMDDDEHVAVLEGTGPGSSPKWPLALVCKTIPVGEFKIKIKATRAHVYSPCHPEWMGHKENEVLHTDGVTRSATWMPGNASYFVYWAQNTEGQTGWVVMSSTTHV